MSATFRLQPEQRPVFDRVVEIVMDHLLHAESHPSHLDEIALRLSCSPLAALAVAIAAQVHEEFSVSEREEV